MHGTVLIVEDDHDIRESLKDVLSFYGYQSVGVENGQEALDALNQQKVNPCLILLDLMMPVMNGWQFREKQKADPELSKIPVVVVSADGGAERKASDIGAYQGLTKPIDFDALIRCVQRFCS